MSGNKSPVRLCWLTLPTQTPAWLCDFLGCRWNTIPPFDLCAFIRNSEAEYQRNSQTVDKSRYRLNANYIWYLIRLFQQRVDARRSIRHSQTLLLSAPLQLFSVMWIPESTRAVSQTCRGTMQCHFDTITLIAHTGNTNTQRGAESWDGQQSKANKKRKLWFGYWSASC